MGKTIIFDFDGTVMNSEEGIVHCAGKGLEHFGIPVPDRKTMLEFIGPPLYKTFIKFGSRKRRQKQPWRCIGSITVPVENIGQLPTPVCRSF